MKKQMFIVGMGTILIVVILSGCTDNLVHIETAEIDFVCTVDVDNATLTVKELSFDSEVYPNGLYWDRVRKLPSGNATLPTDAWKINVGDVLTNCNGTLILIYQPTDQLLGEWDFTS